MPGSKIWPAVSVCLYEGQAKGGKGCACEIGSSDKEQEKMRAGGGCLRFKQGKKRGNAASELK